ncbi:hypothetical protein GHT06_020433 [Daphnia sinensis]|uniref:Uncharacterized protein n=1 Tax=Daphnia sinensis TaxID=1820382 RepID=A0AAD5L7P3_9CRUS|nr:hypothetical protein GHT06_020433 [Daphnia sinensis]
MMRAKGSFHVWKSNPSFIFTRLHKKCKKKGKKAVREHEEPNDKYVEFEYLTRRICDSWVVARALLRKAVEQSDINMETDRARTSKRKRMPKNSFSPNQSSAVGEDSDDKTDSAQGEKQKRKISNQAKKLKLPAKSQRPKKDECRDLSPLRDFDDLSNSENGEETDVPLKKQTNKMHTMPTLNNVLGSKNRQAVLTSFLTTAKKNNTLGETLNKTPKPSAKDKDRCSTLAGSKIAHVLTKTHTLTLKKPSNSKKTLQSLPKESDRGNTQPVSKIAHGSKKAATLTQGGSNSAKPKNAVPRVFKSVRAFCNRRTLVAIRKNKWAWQKKRTIDRCVARSRTGNKNMSKSPIQLRL